MHPNLPLPRAPSHSGSLLATTGRSAGSTCHPSPAHRAGAGDWQRAGLAARIARQWKVPLAHAGARGLRPVRLPLPAFHRAAPCAAGRSQPGQLPVALVHGGAGAGVPMLRTLQTGRSRTSWRPLPALPARRSRSSAAAAPAAPGPGATCRRWLRPSSGPATRSARAGSPPFRPLPSACSGWCRARSRWAAMRCWSPPSRSRRATGCWSRCADWVRWAPPSSSGTWRSSAVMRGRSGS